MATEEWREEAEAAAALAAAAAAEGAPPEPEEIVYRTKVVKFFNRLTPIVLQNDNGPCPLLAICNVLLLRNHLNLSLDASEVSQQKLLSLVAERLIDFNSNVQDKDDGYVNNQQQNIADAIDLLPQLATGIDVNVHFRKINDFEFTRECAIFDLLDIGLYHGWIVDPQDTETAAAIGSKSYNTIVAELVAYEARKPDGEYRSQQDEDFVDFAAATTATLGVPSPSLSRGISFDDCPVPAPVEQRRKGDIEEDEELMRALNLSRSEISSPVSVSMSPVADCGDSSPSLVEVNHVQSSDLVTHPDALGVQMGDELSKIYESEPFAQESIVRKSHEDIVLEDDGSLFQSIATGNNTDNAVSEESGTSERSGNSAEDTRIDTVKQNHALSHSPDESSSGRCCSYEDLMVASGGNQSVTQTITINLSTSQIHEDVFDGPAVHNSPVVSGPAAPCDDLKALGVEELSNPSGVVNSSLVGSEPIYEGEECMLESRHSLYEIREPIYEGEVVLAKHAEKIEGGNHLADGKDGFPQKQWQVIRNFLEHNASQLTFYGIFCLQEGLREGELCVFFRNNHFSTMFKFNGELYLLATDQGYINQPDLVWEKLNEVNGDTVFMTGNFKEFKADNQASDSWNEHSAISSTVEYLAALENSSPNSTVNSDRQLAIALQQQELEQQPQRRQVQQMHPQEPSIASHPRLITGPQVPSRSSAASQKSESKSSSKEKCIVM